MKLSREKVREVIRLAEERDKEEAYNFQEGRIRKSKPIVDLLSPKELELDRYIYALSNEEQRELVALMWFGRDKFDILSDAVTYAKWAPTAYIAVYLQSRMLLTKHLNIGFDKSYWEFPSEEKYDPNEMPW